MRLEALGQDVDEKAADELVDCQPGCFESSQEAFSLARFASLPRCAEQTKTGRMWVKRHLFGSI
jgi:hypothetical protein